MKDEFKGKMTVEYFLARGYKFVEGDIYTGVDGKKYKIGFNVTEDSANNTFEFDDERFVISAKALEEKARTTVRYEKVKFDKLSEAFKEHEKAPLCILSHDSYVKISDKSLVCAIQKGIQLYRKVEAEISPMQAAKDACKKTLNDHEHHYLDTSLNSFVETEVDDDYSNLFIKACREVVNAYDGK